MKQSLAPWGLQIQAFPIFFPVPFPVPFLISSLVPYSVSFYLPLPPLFSSSFPSICIDGAVKPQTEVHKAS